MADEPQDKTADIKAIIEQLKGIEPKDFSSALQEQAHDHYNAIFRIGYGASKGDFEPKLTASQGEIEKLKKEIEARESRIQELSDKAPDVSKVQAKYEATLEQKALEMQNLEKELKAKYQEAMQLARSKDEDRFWSDFKRTLVSRHGVDEDYADVLSQKQDVRKRVRWQDDGSQKVYQDDVTTPFPLSDGQKAYEVLAKDMIKAVPAKFIYDRKPSDTNYGRLNGGLEDMASMPDDQVEKAMEKLWSGRL